MSYRPSTPKGEEPKDVLEWARKEFENIEKGLSLSDFICLKQLSSPPNRFIEGLTVLADGVGWNPGSGQGVYTYYNSAWHKLG